MGDQINGGLGKVDVPYPVSSPPWCCAIDVASGSAGKCPCHECERTWGVLCVLKKCK